MLARLLIRDVVLIDRLDLAFPRGLCVLTGETGAGKSILLDSLGLALGERAVAGLVRHGADRAQVSASFEVPETHPARQILHDRGIEDEPVLVLRRILNADGRSRAFVNDQPVSIGLLAELGAQLVEIHGQHENRGLMNPSHHRALVDAFAGNQALLDSTAEAWRHWQAARKAEAEARDAARDARRDELFQRQALADLDSLDPRPGEILQLEEERRFLAAGSALATALDSARRALAEDQDVGSALNQALRALDRQKDKAGGRLDTAIGALERAILECDEALAAIAAAAEALDADPGRQQVVEDRLHALKALARTHGCDPDALADLAESLRRTLAALDDSGEDLARLARETATAEARYRDAALRLRNSRNKAALALKTRIARELPPLKLEKARFETEITPLDWAESGPEGADRVRFLIATNPGTTPGALNKIASGGEAARIMLALKVVLARDSALPTLIFDEVDAGISGATAAAVGERLSRLGDDLQVLVVTHSPQVAARGAWHGRVHKGGAPSQAITEVESLDGRARREEIARMLAGAEITDEARAAADRLLSGGGG